jgi:tetratricopeptide (TPR) repeat protein
MKTKLITAVLFLLAAFYATSAGAQTGGVTGTVLDGDGKPLAGATVEMTNNETGRKYSLKTDAKGHYQSLGVVGGRYNVTLSKDNQVLTRASNFPVAPGSEDNTLDFDLRKERAQGEQQMSDEQRAKRDAAIKENEKIAGLNDMLKQSAADVQAAKYDDAVQIMRKATTIDASHDLLWGRLCEVDLLAGKHTSDRAQAQPYFQDALGACTKAIALKPAAVYYTNLADADARLGKTDEAAQQYALAAQLDPPNAARYNFNQGAVLTNAGKVDEANAAFDRAIAADPKYADAYYQKAINLMAKATIDPKTGAMSAPPELAANLNKYLELAPNGPNAATAKQFLEQLGAKIETSYGKGGTKKK